MTTLLLASNNPGKLVELRALLAPLHIRLLDPLALHLNLEIEEIADHYAGNARLKAVRFAEASGMWALADDSGLEVDALQGAPGPRSARLVGPIGTDHDRRMHLLSLLRTHPRPWNARFQSVTALANPQGNVDLAQGTCQGEIVPHERGTGGFGYDPIFLVAGTNQTMAELDLEEKNRLSHRARAIQKLLPVIRQRLGIQDPA
ncbi:MAG: RdgB/HAM1 family non-canonical purine NTP pyrophosphatase [Anaerolineales bacterium]|jgi:XTP/dITP diphosphohydrolase